ncbi:MAG TPA: cupin domain-containing protein [Methylomirabilota bacterium]|nr:cupin domain-containing protein [Methylomirabilota bacterium]
MMKRLLIASVSSLFLITAAVAQQPAPTQVAQAAGEDQALPKGFKVTPVLKSSHTASNMPVEYPKTGKAEIVSVIGELEPGGRTALHQHPVPVFVYVLEGTLTVQAQGGQPREYKAGQAFVEDVNHWHQALNKGGTPVKILVVFAGEQGKPTTINAK